MTERFKKLWSQASPIPTIPYLLNPKRIEKYLEGLCPETKEGSLDAKVAQLILAQTQYVDFKTEYKFVQELAKELEEKLKGKKWTLGVPLDYITGKSNLWIFKLALESNPGLKQNFYPDASANAKQIHQKEPSLTQFVIFDDAIWSGTQVMRYIKDFIATLDNQQPVDLYVVAPFMSRKLSELLSSSSITLPPNLSVHLLSKRPLISYYDQMYPLIQKKWDDALLKDPEAEPDLSDLKDLELKGSSHGPKYNPKNYPYYFQWKLADSLSSYPNL